MLGAYYVTAEYMDPTILDACYTATNVQVQRDGTADLLLGGKPCYVFGDDIQRLTLGVVYETGTESYSFHTKFQHLNFIPLPPADRIYMKTPYEVPSLYFLVPTVITRLLLIQPRSDSITRRPRSLSQFTTELQQKKFFSLPQVRNASTYF